ncbi:uncharacterized protein LOC119831683 [Zerene cesonia]|uniref:uncharacterized protein LOC119831683 n=1 Tax=Zerene cesonia TaxID=33412 RepID=UPI0018E59462|nr:uncharacterized protein LOC119831683 [Zerene cesonia]
MLLSLFTVLFILFDAVACDQCDRLHTKYKGPVSGVRYQGEEYDVVVQGGGGAAKAEAALLLAIIRHVHRYTARLDPTEAYFCNVTQIQSSPVVLTTAAIMNKYGCGNENRQIDPVASFNAPVAAEVNLRFMARVHSDHCKNRITWQFLQTDAVKDCGFYIKQNSHCQIDDVYNMTRSLAIIARNETIHDKLALFEFEKRVTASKLPLEFVIYNNDTSFRRMLYQLLQSNKTFLFIDENIWSGIPDIFVIDIPPIPETNCVTCVSDALYSINAVRTGDGLIVKKFAPHIYKTFTTFSPKINVVRNILQYEANANVKDVEEAACLWANENTEEFEKLYQKSKKNLHTIVIFLCADDPYNKYYEIAINSMFLRIQNEIKDFSIAFNETLINCTNQNDLNWGMHYLYQLDHVAGAIAWSWNVAIPIASNTAKYADFPLMLAGPAVDTYIGNATYATSGRFSHLAKGYHYFLSKCDWNRVAIISDDTVYSKDFLQEILTIGNLSTKIIYLNQKNFSTNLVKLKYDGARIFIVNTCCQLANNILAQGRNLFSPIENYVWIVRDWCILDKNKSIEELVFYTIDFAWRGGKPWGGSQKLRNDISNKTDLWAGDTVKVPGTSYLYDAILQLAHGFAAYLTMNPSYRYDLHGKGAIMKFDKAMNSLNLSGVAQFVQVNNNSLNNPVIFVEKWKGSERRTMAILQILNKSVVELWQLNKIQDTCHALLDAERVPDKKICVIRSGDDFAPRCHDVPILVFGISLILTCCALFIAQKIRRDRLLAYNKSVLIDILETRHKNASSLAAFLVDRGSVKLLHEIGSGYFGRVYFAELSQPGHGTQVVAAKEPHEDITPLEENEFIGEACVLARLHHTNVIKLMGVCLANGSPLMLMEHALYLDLIRFLTERRHLAVKAREELSHAEDLEVSDVNLTKWAFEATSALEYLSIRRIVHRDVRAANCLLDKKLSLKLADFGLARELDKEDPTYMTTRKALFPVLWMAPESLECGVFGLASDIWALGVLFLEIATLGSRPYGDWPAHRVIKYVIGGGYPPLPPDTSLSIRKLLYKCWCRDSDHRITASEIREQLLQDPKLISPALLLPELPLVPPIQNMNFNFIT